MTDEEGGEAVVNKLYIGVYIGLVPAIRSSGPLPKLLKAIIIDREYDRPCGQLRSSTFNGQS
jgi:hypothetical protein